MRIETLEIGPGMPMGRRPDLQLRARMRDEILQVAGELFAHRGYRRTTLQDVAQALHVTRPDLYHYVRSKQEILTAIYARVMDRIEAQLAEVLELRLDPRETLRQVLARHVEFVVANRAIAATFFEEKDWLPVEEREQILIRKRNYNRRLQEVIFAGQEQGFFRPVPAGIAVNAMLGMCNWSYQWFSESGTLTPKEMGDLLADLAVSALSTDGTAASSKRGVLPNQAGGEQGAGSPRTVGPAADLAAGEAGSGPGRSSIVHPVDGHEGE